MDTENLKTIIDDYYYNKKEELHNLFNSNEK